MARNKIKTSNHYLEIHERLAKGEPPKDVRQWLIDNYDEEISLRTFQRYVSELTQQDKIKIEYNKRKSKKKKEKAIEEKTDEIVKEKVDELEKIDECTDEFTETFVDDLEIIGRWINKLNKSINLKGMSEYQKSCFLTSLLSIHLKFVGISSDNELINILNFFDDDGDILNGFNNSKKDTS